MYERAAARHDDRDNGYNNIGVQFARESRRRRRRGDGGTRAAAVLPASRMDQDRASAPP